MDYVRNTTSRGNTYEVELLDIARDKTKKKQKLKDDYDKAIQKNRVRRIRGITIDEKGNVTIPEVVSDERIKWEIIDKVIKLHNSL